MKHPVFTRARSEEIQNAVKVLNKELGVDLKVEEKDGVFEINFDELVEKLSEPKNYEDVLKNDDRKIKFQKISPYPFMLRDIAVFVPEGKGEQDVLNVIKENAGDLLVRTKLFDVFEKTFEDETKKTSYAFNLVFQSQEKTLTDEEINGIMEEITNKMSENGWMVR